MWFCMSLNIERADVTQRDTYVPYNPHPTQDVGGMRLPTWVKDFGGPLNDECRFLFILLTLGLMHHKFLLGDVSMASVIKCSIPSRPLKWWRRR